VQLSQRVSHAGPARSVSKGIGFTLARAAGWRAMDGRFRLGGPAGRDRLQYLQFLRMIVRSTLRRSDMARKKLYAIDEDGREVQIQAIGVKDGNRLMIAGKEVEL
jgi:hypothetical protein